MWKQFGVGQYFFIGTVNMKEGLLHDGHMCVFLNIGLMALDCVGLVVQLPNS